MMLLRFAILASLTCTTLLIIPLYGAISDPSLLWKYWDFYLIFLGIPYVATAVIYLLSKRSGSDGSPRN